MAQPKPNLWETLASTQETPPENNGGWEQSDGWGLSLNNDSNKGKSEWRAKPCSRMEPNPHSWTHQSRSRSPGRSRSRNVRRDSRSPAGDLRKIIDRGSNWNEESPSPPYRGRNETRRFQRYREPCRDLRKGSWSNSKEEASRSTNCSTPNFGRDASRPDWIERNPGEEKCSHSLNANFSKYTTSQGTSTVLTNRTQVKNENQLGLSSLRIKFPDLNDEVGHNGCGPCSPVMTGSKLKSSSPLSHALQEVNKSGNVKESDGWGPSSCHVDRSRSRSLSPWSRAAVQTKQNSESKETEGWGKALDRTGLDAWNRTESDEILINGGSNRWRGGQSPSRSRDRSISTEGRWKRAGQDGNCSPGHKWRKTRWHLDRSRKSEHSVSPENRSIRTCGSQDRSRGRGRTCDRSRGRGSTGPPVSLNRFNRSRGMSPTSANKTKDEREEQSGFSSPRPKHSDPNEKTGSDRWNQTSPNVNDSRSISPCQWSQVAQESTKNANQKESVGWGTNSSPVKKLRSRSLSPWSQAARDIDKNYNNKETDGWGKDLNQIGPDAWSQPRSNISPDVAFKRRGGWGLKDQSLSPEPNSRRTRRDLDRTRGRDDSYSPNNRHRRSGWDRGRSPTDSAKRCQNRRERRSPLNSQIDRCRGGSLNLHRSPSRVPRMDRDRDRREGIEGRDDKKTNGGANTAEVPSWECLKWHDWSVNALRNSVRDSNLIFNSGDLTDTQHKNDPNTTRTAASYPKVVQTSTEGKVSGTAEIQNSVAGTTNLPLLYDPWNNDAVIPSSDATGTLLVNPEASQCLSSQKNSAIFSSVEANKSMLCGHQTNATTSILTSHLYPSAPWSNPASISQENPCSTWGPSTAPFKYPTLEPKINIASTSSLSNCSGPKSNFIPIGCGPPQMSMPNLNTPTTFNRVDSAARPSEMFASFPASLPVLTSSGSTNTAIARVAPLCSADVSDVPREPYQPRSGCIVSSTPSANPEARFSESNIDVEREFTSFTSPDTKAGVSQDRGTGAKADSCAVNPVGPAPVVSKAGPSETIQNPVAGFSTNAVTQPISCMRAEVGTSQTRGSDTEAQSSAVNPVGPTQVVPKVGLSQRNKNTVVGECSDSNNDAVMQPTSCKDTKVGTYQARGTDAQAEFSTFSRVSPTPVVPKVGRPEPNRNSIMEPGTGAKIEEAIFKFKLAVADFAKPKLRPFWLKRYLTNKAYLKLLEEFVENVTTSLETRDPKAYENRGNFIKKENDSLSKFLQKCLGTYVNEGVIKDMRDEEKLDKPLVFP